jgi:glycosyltransferase involved in cell wall biosynthesis
MNCIIISESASFPWGMAATSRVRMLAKGLIFQQNKVRYVGLKGAGAAYSNHRTRNGSFENIDYHYPGLFTVRSNNWFLRRIDDFTSKWMALVYVIYLKIKGKLDVGIIYTRNPGVLFFWTKVLHYLKTPVLLELCEWPLANVRTNGKDITQAKKFCIDGISIVDGVLPISVYIEEEVRRIGMNIGTSIPSFRIPILIDPSSFRDSQLYNEVRYPYLLYSGFIKYTEIARLIVDIMANLNERKIEIKILFTGGGKPEEFNKLKEYASEKNVLSSFEFTGYIDEPHLIRLMKNAVALLAPIPDDLQSKARFPTKLGYYLASGRPVITTPYGEISKYLKDGENAYMAAGFSGEKVAERIKFVLSNPETASNVGKKGAETAMKYFNYATAMRGINEFMIRCKKAYNR